MQNDKLALFEEKEIKKYGKTINGILVLLISFYVLTDSNKPRDYWYRIKQRVNEEEENELSTVCRQLKLMSSDEILNFPITVIQFVSSFKCLLWDNK